MPKKTTTSSSRGLHAARLPGEAPKYRAARDRLLKNEIALRRQIEAVAAERRALPLGGALKEDYVFDEIASTADHTAVRRQVRLSDLFEKGKDTLVVYSYMFGPRMAAPCPCARRCSTAWTAAPRTSRSASIWPSLPNRRSIVFFGCARPGLAQSAAAFVGRQHLQSRLPRREREGRAAPMLNVFTRRQGRIQHTYGTELLFAPADRGQDGRHVDCHLAAVERVRPDAGRPRSELVSQAPVRLIQRMRPRLAEA